MDGYGWIWMDMDGYGWIWMDMEIRERRERREIIHNSKPYFYIKPSNILYKIY